MISAPKSTLSLNNFKVMKVYENLTNLSKKFCESPPWGSSKNRIQSKTKPLARVKFNQIKLARICETLCIISCLLIHSHHLHNHKKIVLLLTAMRFKIQEDL